MKELKKISSDKINYGDKRFIFNEDHGVRPAELPVFYEIDGQYIPFKAYQIHEKLVDAFVYSPDSDYADMIDDMIRDMQLSIFDQARLMIMLESHEQDLNKKEWARRFKLPVDKWDQIKSFSNYEDAWQQYLSDKKVPLKRILHFEDKTLRDILSPLLELNPGINVLESIAGLTNDIAHIEKKLCGQIWLEMDMTAILEAEDLTGQMKLQQIKQSLYEKRYPTISRYRHQLDMHLKAIPRSAGLDLRSDENFETPGMRLQADLRSRQDIDKLQDWLKEQKSELEKIMDIQKGKEE